MNINSEEYLRNFNNYIIIEMQEDIVSLFFNYVFGSCLKMNKPGILNKYINSKFYQ